MCDFRTRNYTKLYNWETSPANFLFLSNQYMSLMLCQSVTKLCTWTTTKCIFPTHHQDAFAWPLPQVAVSTFVSCMYEYSCCS